MSLGPPGAQFNPDTAENFEDIEKQFAVRVVQHMETYWSLLRAIPGSRLKLTKIDDEIHGHFRREFADLDVRGPLDEDAMKSKEGKERWRGFIKEYEERVEDFNFGCMLRARADAEYGEEGTIFAVRMQFYAVEVARNKEGLNDWVYEKAQAEKEEEKAEKEKGES